MSKDVKIEILYFKTPVDVSLEFGLRGDYPLRMLSSVCDDIPSFFHSLKRAVSRSEIIFVVGGYNEEDRLPTFIARALGKKCTVPNYGKLGVIAEEKHLLPEGAVPLAPKSRRFGGFLLECGPQAIISLCDNKKIRLELVEQFVVTYITEHHNVFNQPFAIEKPTNDSLEGDNGEGLVIPTEFSDISSTSVAEIGDSTAENEQLSDEAVPIAPLIIDDIPMQSDTESPADNDVVEEGIETADEDDASEEDAVDLNGFSTLAEATAVAAEIAAGAIDAANVPEAKLRINIDPDELFLDNYDVRYEARHRRSTVRTLCLVFSLIILIGLAVLLILSSKIINDVDTAANISSGSTSYYSSVMSTPDESNVQSIASEVSKWTPSTEEESKPEGDRTENDFHGETSDIVLPLPPVFETTSSDTSTSSGTASSFTSTELSSLTSSYENTSSNISVTTSSQQSVSSSTVTSSQRPVSSSQIVSSNPITSSTVSSTVSSAISSVVSASSSSVSSTTNPNIDPIYTWDLELSCIDKADGKKYTDSAVRIVAMIIEDEMSPTIDPPEALIAQAIVKYNWLINNNARNPDKAPTNALDPNPTPQALQYAEAAKGIVLMYGNTLAKTYCYAYSAGVTANIQDIWGGTAYPYLQSVDCSVDKQLKDFETRTTYSAEYIKGLILEKCGIDVSNMSKSDWIKPIQYDNNGAYCLKVSIGGKEYNGRYLRETLLANAVDITNPDKPTNKSIRSTAYTVTYNEANDTFTVTCKGYGHGVGFSQRGAKTYAYNGWNHEQILMHFFPGTTLIKV